MNGFKETVMLSINPHSKEDKSEQQGREKKEGRTPFSVWSNQWGQVCVCGWGRTEPGRPSNWATRRGGGKRGERPQEWKVWKIPKRKVGRFMRERRMKREKEGKKKAKRYRNKTGRGKVLHGNTKTPTDLERRGKKQGKTWKFKKKQKDGCSSLLMPQFGVVDPPDVEVLHVDVPVGGSLPLAPQQQTLLSRGLWKK